MTRNSLQPPLVLALVFSSFVALYLLAPSAYRLILGFCGVAIYATPFLDLDGTVTAIQCAGQGLNVFRTNPCDVLGRVHNYSPLWLSLDVLPMNRSWTPWLGLGLDGAFIASLAWLPAMMPGWRRWLFLAGCLSYVTAYALERANVDLLIFVLIVAAGRLLVRGGIAAPIGHAVILFAGLLKFYPLAALAMLARESPRLMAGLATAALLLIVGLAWLARADIATLLGAIPRDYDDMFGATHLPGALTILLGGPAQPGGVAGTIPLLVLAVVVATTGIKLLRLMRMPELAAGYRALPADAAIYLALGALLIVACFFAGQSANYRAILLLPALAGMLQLHHILAPGPARNACRNAIILTLCVLWSGPFHGLHATLSTSGSTNPIAFGVAVALWLIFEILWWQLIAFLSAMVLIFLTSGPLWTRLRQGRPA